MVFENKNNLRKIGSFVLTDKRVSQNYAGLGRFK